MIACALNQALIASFNFVPILKPTALLSAIFNGSPVAGFRPVRAARVLIDKLANPGKTSESPFANNSVMHCITALTALSESFLVNPAVLLTASINSCLFIFHSFRDRYDKGRTSVEEINRNLLSIRSC